jgi:glycosyltransferase involved in cell wall biosynthesis
VLANSALTARHAVDLLGVPAERVHTVYYGADPARFHPPTPQERRDARRALGIEGDGAVLAFVGALGDRRKGFATLFDAFVRLGGEGLGWDATLLVAGGGAEVAAWSARARVAGLAGRVRFLGFQGDIRPLLFASDLLVAPTRYEAYGLAVQEALCCGVPALVSRAAGVAERIPAALQALLLDDPADPAELARRLRAWHAHRDAYRAAAQALSAVLRAWTWDHMAARCVDIAEGRA